MILVLFLFTGCNRSSQELPVTPPPTHPLARQHIGYGVVNVSFTHLLSEPGPAGVSHGHLRRGTVLRIIERRQIVLQGNSQSWVLAEENYEPSPSRGWLQEATVEIFDRESRANTASRFMLP
ncbi:MAG: hypothetical protein FWB99_03975 [Treponema sp.]|nr:hypothetical protein [Treponema sp.]